MAFEMLYGLNVIDDEKYQQYREAMMPILHTYGGGFGYDFKIFEVLRSQTEANINRVFTIYFPDEETKNRFFADSDYLRARKTYYTVSVAETTIIATYEN